MDDLLTTSYLFLIALVLALLEVQIEVPHGWASGLPTWKFAHPRWLALANGKPLTGYHACMIPLLLLLFHLPAVRGPWSWREEGQLLSQFFLVAVFWDFLWFVLNPHYGLRRFRSGEVWWCRRWLLGLPIDYWGGLALSSGLGAVSGNPGLGHGAHAWAIRFGLLCGLTLLTAAVACTWQGTSSRRDRVL